MLRLLAMASHRVTIFRHTVLSLGVALASGAACAGASSAALGGASGGAPGGALGGRASRLEVGSEQNHGEHRLESA